MWKWPHSRHWDKSDVWRIKPCYKDLESQKHIAQYLPLWSYINIAMTKEGPVILLRCKTKHLLSSFKDTAKPGGIQLQVFKHGPDFLVHRGNQYRTGRCTRGFTGAGNGVGPWTTLPSSKPLSPSLTWQLNNYHNSRRKSHKCTPVLPQSVLNRYLKSSQYFICFHNA